MAPPELPLEEGVRALERSAIAHGLAVDVRRRERAADGVARNEFDVVVRGRFGPADLRWLIECRDRPDDGAAPAAWIAQLAAKRAAFGFNKVSAVAATAYAADALALGRRQEVECLGVQDLAPPALAGRFAHDTFRLVERTLTTFDAQLLIDHTEGTARNDALQRALRAAGPQGALLRSSATGRAISPLALYRNLCLDDASLVAAELVDGDLQPIDRGAEFPFHDDFFTVATDAGNLRIRAVRFTGEARTDIRDVTAAMRDAPPAVDANADGDRAGA